MSHKHCGMFKIEKHQYRQRVKVKKAWEMEAVFKIQRHQN